MKHTLLKKILTVSLTAFCLILAYGAVVAPSYAQDTIGGPKPGTIGGGKPDTIGGGKNNKGFIQNPLKADNLTDLTIAIMDVAVKLGSFIAFLALLWVGFQFVVAQGKPEKIADARKHFFYIIIGIAVLLGAKVIIEIIKATLSPFVDTGLLGK